MHARNERIRVFGPWWVLTLKQRGAHLKGLWKCGAAVARQDRRQQKHLQVPRSVPSLCQLVIESDEDSAVCVQHVKVPVVSQDTGTHAQRWLQRLLTCAYWR